MKKLIFSLLIVMVIVLSLCVFISCDKDSEGTPRVNVKFMIDDKVVSESQYKTGEYIQDPNIKEFENKKVVYWTINGLTEQALFPVKAGSVDLTFYAYTTQKITVTYYVGDSEYAKYVYKTGDIIYAPESPSKEGSQFKYWAINDEIAQFPINTAKTSQTEFEFRAVFDNIFNVSFISNGEEILSELHLNGDAIYNTPETSLDRHTFIYWVDENGQQFKEGTIIHSNRTYTALFEEDYYKITYLVGSSNSLYHTLYTTSAAIDLKYEGEGNFYGWYLDKKYTTKYDFSKPVTSDVTIYGKLYTSKYELTVANLGSKAPIDNSDIYSTYGFNTSDAPSTIAISNSLGNIDATYKFTCNGKDAKITYNMITKGEIECSYGAVSKIKISVPKYNYADVDFSSYVVTDLKNGLGNTYYNQKLEQLAIYVATCAVQYVYEAYNSAISGGVVTNGEEKPDKDYTINISSENSTINLTTSDTYYSVKVLNSEDKCIYYSTNQDQMSVSNLERGTYKIVVIFANKYPSYILRQYYTELVQVK